MSLLVRRRAPFREETPERRGLFPACGKNCSIRRFHRPSPGNGILRVETGGRIQAQSAGERPEFGSQTVLRLANLPESRGFLSPQKPGRFARTERRGFEPMAIAVSRPRIAGFRQRISKAMRGRPDCGRRRSRNATATVARRCADHCRTRRSNWRSSRRSPFLNRAEPRQGHRTSIAAANAHRPLD